MTTKPNLTQQVDAALAAHPGQTGVLPLTQAQHAFVARLHLAEQAQQRLDLQYYLWRADRTGTFLFEAVHAAAERGVKVRILLDDFNTAGLDALLITLARHPNIEVKLFNALRIRWPRFINYFLDFSRLNRRMHNKAWLVDGKVLISGGRNIGDEYFGATDARLFADLDALLIGPVVDATQRAFEAYWDSASAVSVEHLLDRSKSFRLSMLAKRAQGLREHPFTQDYLQALTDDPFWQAFRSQQLNLHWTDAQLVVDSPSKGHGVYEQQHLLAHQLQQSIGLPKSEFLIVSPYFVPTHSGYTELVKLARSGVAITLLTNSLEATDVAVVHAGYAKWRKRLLEAGVKIFELQRLSPLARKQEKRARRKKLNAKERLGTFASSLHAKTFVVDGARVFLGSFNFDPRSTQLNTELGFVIDSQHFAKTIQTAFKDVVPNYAYQLDIANHRLIWRERIGRQERIHLREPGASIWRRMASRVLSWLPIDWML